MRHILMIATNAKITANATCGQRGPESFCKLVEHIIGRSPQCDYCDANNKYKRHPIENAIDGTSAWWQSPSLANGLEYENVDIVIDLRQEYKIAYIIVKAGNAPRPGTWILEKSLDGVNYTPWQYYAMSDSECMRQFGVPATVGVPKFKSDDEVICTSLYSKREPLEHGEIHTSLVNHRPGVDQPSKTLLEFTRARFVRIRLLKLQTLNADLMIINRKHGRLDASVTRRYFYSIKDISIGGQCICYGHADSCPSDPETGQFKCHCQHNTYGDSCSECLPLYNQYPWRPGTNFEHNICQPCQCFNHADRCEYDEQVQKAQLSMTPDGIFEGGGKCIDCKHNTAGINCEVCKDGFYRPAGMSHYREDACHPCDCNLEGSEHLSCVRDETESRDGKNPGDCHCKPGFGGRRCDRCAPGFRNYPICEPCPCNQAGSLNFDVCEEDKCICKANVEGVHCNQCKKGTINLDVNNHQGCQKCFCFGLSNECVEKKWKLDTLRPTTGFNLTDWQNQKNIPMKGDQDTDALMYTTSDYKNDQPLHYWRTPKEFTGNILNSYGGNLKYFVYFVPSQQTQVAQIADVIIEGNGIQLEYHSRQEFFPRENVSVVIPMKEASGWFNSQSRSPVEKIDMMRVLSDVKFLLIRAIYRNGQIQSTIYGISLDIAKEIDDSNEMELVDMSNSTQSINLETFSLNKSKGSKTYMKSVEVCQCPENFEGNSCERCKKGYRRVNNQLYGGKCEKCDCNGHSDDCDPFTGACINCQHNTTGDMCEQCIQGHVGNPILGGILGSCSPCACPSLDNNHSKDCVLAQLGISGTLASQEDSYICTSCDQGYDGNKCEFCADGFYGDPLATNGTCVPCDCNNNIDPADIGNCDIKTGKCLKCIYNTAGDHCEKCENFHWGDANKQTCKPCGCHSVGSLSQSCDIETGKCECKENYVGEQCNKCISGHGDIEHGCPACDCNELGSEGIECDEVSGQCSCKVGVFGKNCDRCLNNYFNFTSDGCQYCHCNPFGSVDEGNCDSVTGECECKSHVEGTMCEKCSPGFYNITSGFGCQPCECDPIGSISEVCNDITGVCLCKPGVTGEKCDKCEPNYYGLNEEGCKKCQVCKAEGQVCDSKTGECICPINTVGDMCQECTENAWDYHPLKGCKLCNCDVVGSIDGKCDSLTGQCLCKAGYVGPNCNLCSNGYFNFPDCEPCNCNPNGTLSSQCNGDLCLCDNDGQCPCKNNVMGLKCDECKENSFSLSGQNNKGCTECFCFGRSDKCEQSNLYWQQIYGPDREVTFSSPFIAFTKKHNIRLLKEYPPKYYSYPTDSTPLYWPAPKNFLGDKITSYNGYIRFKIHCNDNRNGIVDIKPESAYFKYFPQVILIGNDRLVLEHIPNEISSDGKYKIHLHESQWRSRFTPQLKVTRAQLMTALQNLQAIYIRATYNYLVLGDQAGMKELSLDVAINEDELGEGQLAIKAIGVEMCHNCEDGYDGSSCQNPASGYFRKKNPDYLNSPNDIDLIGYATPCACNSHSKTCDPETGRCLDCKDNTLGDFCEYCKPGYYGNATDGYSISCTKCECPSHDRSFSETCIPISHGRGFMCDSCKKGYTGMYCEKCIDGYFGDPSVDGGKCEACNCNPHGSIQFICDKQSGQCECHDGVTGRNCDLCEDRHAFIDGVCTTCDRGCTKELMYMVDKLEDQLSTSNFSNLKPVPWKRVSRIENTTKDINTFIHNIKIDNQTILDIEPASYLKDAKVIFDESSFIFERQNKTQSQLLQFIKEAESIYEEGRNQRKNIYDVTSQLRQFTLSGGAKLPMVEVEYLITEAKEFLEGTKNRGQYIDKRFHSGMNAYNKSKNLLDQVFKKKLNESVFSDIKNQIEDFIDILEGYQDTLWDNARTNTKDATMRNAALYKKVENLKHIVAEIEEVEVDIKNKLRDSDSNINVAKQEKLLEMFDDYNDIKENLKENLNGKITELKTISDTYGEEYNEMHKNAISNEIKAKSLEHEAHRIKEAFANTKHATELPVQASTSYKDIIETINNSTNAVEEAIIAIEEAKEHADGENEDSLINSAKKTAAISNDLKNNANEIAKIWDEEYLPEKNIELNERLENLSKAKQESEKIMKSFKEKFSNMEDQKERLDLYPSSLESTYKKAESIKANTDAIAEEVSNLEKEFKDIGSSTGEKIKGTIERIHDIGTGLRTNEDKLNNMDDLTTRNGKKIEELSNKLGILKDKIKEARERASRIKLSVTSNDRGHCVRSFISPIYPSPSNTFNIKYKPSKDVPDSLIMITMTKGRRTQASEYIAIVLQDQRIVAHWNIGNGKKSATNSHPIRYIPINDKFTWYNINLKRTGNSVTLKVVQEQFTPGDSPKKLTEEKTVMVGKFDSEKDVIFNTVPGETKIGFGYDGERNINDLLSLKTDKFRGTVGEFIVDGERVNIWDFTTSTKECDGGVSPSISTSGGFMFKDGFAQVHMTTAERANTMLTIEFSSYSKNGLLYFRGNPETKDFVSLELRDGQVVFKVNLGNNSFVKVVSKGPLYNDGKLHVIRTIRFTNQVHLQVDSEQDRVSETIPGENTALNVNDNDHFIGGVPSDFNKVNFDQFDIHWKGFYGCIKSVKPNQISELDLENVVRSHKKEAGCGYKDSQLEPSDRVVGFEKEGYFATNGIKLDYNSSIALNFRTRDESGIILYQSSSISGHKSKRDVEPEGKGFIAIYIYKGSIVLNIGFDASIRSKMISLKSKMLYNDGMLHSLFVGREEDNIYLRIDDKEIFTNSLNSDVTIGSGDNIIYLGGLPKENSPNENELPVKNGIIGCISNVYYNLDLLPLVPLSHSAIIGDCPSSVKEILLAHDETIITDEEKIKNSERTISKIVMGNIDPHHRGGKYNSIGEDEDEDDYDSNDLTSEEKENYEKSTKQTQRSHSCGTFIKDEDVVASRFGMTQSSHSRVNFVGNEIPDFRNFKLSLEFKTKEKNGMIWVWANYKSYSRYFYLYLTNGRLKFEVSGHKDARQFVIPNIKYNDDKWHKFILIRKDRDVYITVDGITKYVLRNVPHPKVMRKRMFVGGVISKHKKLFNITIPGFNGCIKDFEVNDIKYSLDNPTSSRDIIPCAVNLQSASYIHENGYAVITEPLKYHTSRDESIKLAIDFKTVTPNATIFAILNGKNPDKEKISVMILNGKLYFDFMLKKYNLVEDLILKADMCEGKWHKLAIELSKDETNILIDEQKETLHTKIPDNALKMLREQPIYIGGIQSDIKDKLNDHDKYKSLSGCVKNLKIGERSIEFHQLKKLNKVISNGCPYNE
uniref:Laminin subunit alpha-2 n=1 Tax=Parastrongyloides trichosuri TaxID=131310 RepID=A0A0N4ZF07_PARTI